MCILVTNGAANTTTINNYDALSRVTQFTNPLGVFNQTNEPTRQPMALAMPTHFEN